MSVKVAIRVRPFNQRQKFLGCISCVEMKQNTTIVYQNKQKNKKQHYFTFDYSLWSHDQFGVKENGYMYPLTNKYIDQIKVYNLIGTEILANALQGYNCCLFAYGQTGSGKSYSMIGYGANRGIVPMACQEIFAKIKKNQRKGQKQYEITFSMLQIYNEKVQDLFTPTSKRPQNGLKVRQNKTLGVYVEGLTKIDVHSYADIEKRMDEGSKNRSLASTLMNQYSSRAHTIIMIEFIQKQWINKLKMNKKSSFINLVDLAGSQRVAKTGIESKDRLKQASNINKSLHTLGRVIQTLAQLSAGKTKNLQVPYRDSSLTRILQGALGGNSKTIMICAISPANDNYQQTLSTLRYADQTKKIKNKPVINESAVDKIIRQLRQQNDRLKKMLEAPQEYSLMNSRQLKTQTQKKQIRSNLRASMRQVQKQIKKNLKSFAINTDQVQQEDYQSMMMTEFIELQQPSQFFSQLSFDLGNKAQVYITNLNEDQLLNDKIRYSCEKDILITNKNKRAVKGLQDYAKIVLCGLGIEQNHAKIIRKNDKYFIEALSQTSAQYTLLNGKPVYERRQLFHNDRIILGINSVFIFKNTLKKGGEKQKPIDYQFVINQRQLQMQNLSLISPTSLNLFLSNNFLKTSPIKQIYTPSTNQYSSTKKLFQQQNQKQIMSKLQDIQTQFSKLVKENQQKLRQKQQFYKNKLNQLKTQKQKQKNKKKQLEQKLMIKSLQTQTLKNKNGQLQKLKAKLSKYNEQKSKRKKYRQSFLLQSQDNKIEQDIIGQFIDVEDPRQNNYQKNIDKGPDNYEINIKKKKKIQINKDNKANKQQYADIIVEQVDDNDMIMRQSINDQHNNDNSIVNDSLLLGDQDQKQKEKRQKKRKIQALKKKLTQDSMNIQKTKLTKNINLQFTRLYNIKIRCQIEIDIICSKCSQYTPTNQILLSNSDKNLNQLPNRQPNNYKDAQLQQFYYKNNKKKYLSSEDLKLLQSQIQQLQNKLNIKNYQQNTLNIVNNNNVNKNQSFLLNSSGDNEQNLMSNIQGYNYKIRRQSYESRKQSEQFVDFNISHDKTRSKGQLQLVVNDFIHILQTLPELSTYHHQIQYQLSSQPIPKSLSIYQSVISYQLSSSMHTIIATDLVNPFALTLQLQSQTQLQNKQLLLNQGQQHITNPIFIHKQNQLQTNMKEKDSKKDSKSAVFSIIKLFQLDNSQERTQFVANIEIQTLNHQQLMIGKQYNEIGTTTEDNLIISAEKQNKPHTHNTQNQFQEQITQKQDLKYKKIQIFSNIYSQIILPQHNQPQNIIQSQNYNDNIIQQHKKQIVQTGINTIQIQIIQNQPIIQQQQIYNNKFNSSQQQITIKQTAQFATITDINMSSMGKYQEYYDNQEQQQQLYRYNNNKSQNNQTLNSTINQSISLPFNQIASTKSAIEVQSIETNTIIDVQSRQTNTINIIFDHQATNTQAIKRQQKEYSGQMKEKNIEQEEIQSSLNQKQVEQYLDKLQEDEFINNEDLNKIIHRQNQETNTQQLILPHQSEQHILQKQSLLKKIKELQQQLAINSILKAEKQQKQIITSIQQDEKIQILMIDYAINTSFQDNILKLVQYGMNTSLQLTKLINQELSNLQIQKNNQQNKDNNYNQSKLMKQYIQKSQIQFVGDDEVEDLQEDSSNQIQNYLNKEMINQQNNKREVEKVSKNKIEKKEKNMVAEKQKILQSQQQQNNIKDQQQINQIQKHKKRNRNIQQKDNLQQQLQQQQIQNYLQNHHNSLKNTTKTQIFNNQNNNKLIEEHIVNNNSTELLYKQIQNAIKMKKINLLTIQNIFEVTINQNYRITQKQEQIMQKQQQNSPINMANSLVQSYSHVNSQNIQSYSQFKQSNISEDKNQQKISAFKFSKLGFSHEQILYNIVSKTQQKANQIQYHDSALNTSIGTQYEIQIPQLSKKIQENDDKSMQMIIKEQQQQLDKVQNDGLFNKGLSKYHKSADNSLCNENSHDEQKLIDPNLKNKKKLSTQQFQLVDKFNLSVSEIQKHELSYQQSAFGLDGLLKQEELNHKIKLLQDKIKQLESQNKIQEDPKEQDASSQLQNLPQPAKEDSNDENLHEFSNIASMILKNQEKDEIINPSKYVHLTKKKKKKKKNNLTQQQRKQLQIQRQIQAKIIQCNNENLINERNLQIHKRKREAEELRKVVLKRQKVQLQKQLLILIPMIRRFNLIAREMKRLVQGKISIQYRNFSHFQMIQVLKNYRINKKNYASNLQIRIVIFNLEEGRLYTWTVDIFKNRYEIAEQIFEKYLQNEDAVGSRGNNFQDQSQRAKDPFWDPIDFISQGIGYLSMQSLLYSLSYQGYISLIYKSNIIAKIYVSITPIKIKRHKDEQQDNQDQSSQIQNIQIYNQRNLLQKDIYFTISIESIKFMTNNQKQKGQQPTQSTSINVTALNSNILKYTISYELLEDQYKMMRFCTPQTDFNQEKQFKRIDYMRRHSFKNISETTLAYISDSPIKFTLNVMKDYNEECLNASFNEEELSQGEGTSQLDKSYGSIDDKSSIYSKKQQPKELLVNTPKSNFTKKAGGVIYENTQIVSKIETQAKKQQQRIQKRQKLQESRSKNKGNKGQKDKQCNIY